MNKMIYPVVLGVFFLAACGGGDGVKQAEKIVPEPTKALTSKNSPAFNQSFEKMLSAYDQLKTALVDYDTSAANTAASLLATASDSLAIDEITGDSTGAVKATAASYAASVSTASKALIAAGELEKKKRQFQILSDAFYDLTRTVRYDRQKIYRQHCPMAFNDEESAYWLSTSSEIVNPYLGKRHPKYKDGMLHCGDLADSTNY